MSNNNSQTEGVATIRGDPKKAILKLSGPMIIAMVITSLYSLIDGIWVSGLGQSALASVGFISPIYLVVMGFSSGLGAGATSVISRCIGSGDKKQADIAALHVLILVGILTLIFTVGTLIFLKDILELLGAGSTIKLGIEYGNILFGGSLFIVFTSAAFGILRAEGNVKKTTYAMIFGAIFNIILDPLLIYTLNLQIAGAAIATVISMTIVSLILLYWFKKDTYIDFSPKSFKYSWNMMRKILDVSIPAGIEFLIVAILSGVLNGLLVMVAGIDGVAIYSAGWRVVMIAMVPTISVAISAVAVTGASFGAEKYEDFNIILNYSIKLGLIISSIISIIIFITAPYISFIFTYSPETAGLNKYIVEFLRIMCIFYLFIPIGASSSSIFQGVGKGLDSLVLTAIRELLLVVVFTYILAIPLGLGQYGVWWGVVLGNAVGCIIAFIWSKIYIKKMLSVKLKEEPI